MLAEQPHPRCESCQYSLHGLTKGLCPECGTPFDPMLLTPRWLEVAPTIPWEVTPNWTGFRATCKMMRLARPRISPTALGLRNIAAAAKFSQRCRGLAGLLLLCVGAGITFIAAWIGGKLSMPMASFTLMTFGYAAVCLFVATALCENLMEHLLATAFAFDTYRDTHVPCMLRYLSAHSIRLGIVLGLVGGVGYLPEVIAISGLNATAGLVIGIVLTTCVVLLVVVIANWMCLVFVVVCMRYPQAARRFKAAACIALVAFIAIFAAVGLFVGGVMAGLECSQVYDGTS